MRTDVLYGRAGSPDDSARLPARIQAPCLRATAAKASLNGPGMGWADSRKPSSGPRYWRYSGNAIRLAPPDAASSARDAAAATLALGSGPASVWTRATGTIT